MLIALYALAIVCPSVRPSVTRVYHTTRSQAVARLADRTASQHLDGSRDVIGHVTLWWKTHMSSHNMR